MTTNENYEDTIRKPRQARSQERVELVLETAKKLILEKGCIALKMSDVAKSANITLSSIYQYFPNKTAIIVALCDQYLAENRESIRMAFSDPPKSLKELSDLTTYLFEEYYKLHLEKPVIRDIWAGYSSDKEVQNVDMDDTKQNVETVLEYTSHLFADDKLDEASRALFLILSFCGAASYLAVTQNNIEGRKTMEEAKVMLYACWQASITPLAKT